MNRPAGSHRSSSPLEAIRVVLSQTSHPGNIGAAARAMKTMGLARLLLVNPKHFPDDQALARAAGADDLLTQARVCATVDEALADTVWVCAVTARQRNLGPPALSARAAAREILAWAGEGDVALLFGNETAGLSNAEVQRCQRTVFIPANPEYGSLNLASAVQLLCYELRLAAFDDHPPVLTRTVPFASPPASHQDLERFYEHLERVMVASAFLDPQRPRRLLPKLRRLFGRAELERDEINILRGLLDAIERQVADRGSAAAPRGNSRS
jgi:tRNA/rRNA methyltransferase